MRCISTEKTGRMLSDTSGHTPAVPEGHVKPRAAPHHRSLGYAALLETSLSEPLRLQQTAGQQMVIVAPFPHPSRMPPPHTGLKAPVICWSRSATPPPTVSLQGGSSQTPTGPLPGWGTGCDGEAGLMLTPAGLTGTLQMDPPLPVMTT